MPTLPLVVALSATLAAAPGPTPVTTSTSTYRIVGNRAIPTSVYLYVLDHASQVAAPRDTDAVRETLDTYLSEAGFPYANVQVTPKAGGVEILVDEGTVERIVFPGESGLGAVLAHAVFELDDMVFNTHRYDQAVKALEERLGKRVLGHQMVRTSTSNVFAPLQIHDIGPLADAIELRSLGAHVLLVELEQSYDAPGWGLGLSSTGPDGLILEGRHRWAQVFSDDDRLVLGASIGLRIGDLFGGDAPVLSRGGLGLRWISNPLIPHLRGTVRLGTSYLNRQRLDIGDISYNLLQPESSLGLLLTESDLGEAHLLLGVQDRILLDRNLDPEVQPTTTGAIRGFVDLSGELSLLPSPTRRLDHRLKIAASLRGYSHPSPYGDLRLGVEKGFPLGTYNDIRFKVRGRGLVGDFGIIDEYRVSDMMHGLYGDELYMSAAGAAMVEGFLSFERERFRGSLFLDGIAVRPSEYGEGSTKVRPGISGGLGLHGLIMSTFQASIYGVVGVLGSEPVDVGVNLSLMRLF